MYDYGAAPNSDEVELTVFGPGYGEAIALHLGEGNWLLVDSCLSPQSRKPASLEYLQRLGVPLTQVHTIVASHWHDDHVKGLSEIVQHCPNAELHISAAFSDAEALAFLAAYGGSSAAAHTAGAKELVSSLNSSKSNFLTSHKTVLWEGLVEGRKMRVAAFSPTPAASKQSVARMVKMMPKANAPIKHIPELSPNLEAIVLSVDLGDEAILLGSDLEDHGQLGWSSIVSDKFCLGSQRASTYKVAHHGSITGEHAGIWSDLLTAAPTSVLTPFIRGSVKLPTAADASRLAQLSSVAYISSDGSKRPQLDTGLQRRMSVVAKKLVPINTGFGAIRLRKKLGSSDWKVDLFGNAKQIG
jgi:beta-lactamase superfamily II metal-dependent hydrolase